MDKQFKIHNMAKAAKAEIKHNRQGKLLVRFHRPAGALENKLRLCKPIFHPYGKNDHVAVQAFKGLWLLTGVVARFMGKDGKPLRSNTTGKAFKAR